MTMGNGVDEMSDERSRAVGSEVSEQPANMGLDAQKDIMRESIGAKHSSALALRLLAVDRRCGLFSVEAI